VALTGCKKPDKRNIRDRIRGRDCERIVAGGCAVIVEAYKGEVWTRTLARLCTLGQEEKTTTTMDFTCQEPSINGPAGCSTMVEKY